jgi:transcriptional regulator with XRE-family HTH domain
MTRPKESNLSKRIESLRKKQGLSQEKLARLADVSNNTIINIEAGINNNPTIETIRKITKALGVSVEELIK